MNKYMIRAALFMASLFLLLLAVNWGVESLREQGRQEVRLQYERKLAKAKDDARVATEEMRTQRDKALEIANEREKTIRAMAAASGAATNSLRDELAAIRHSLPDDSAEAARKRADTLADLLGDCAEKYRGVAEKADRHANDADKLSNAWPKQ